MVEFAVEALGPARPDIESLLPGQWAHTGDSDIKCEPNWRLYHEFAERQALMVVMARDFDTPVGYLAAFIYPHPNAVSRKVASIPTYYVVNRPTRALIMSRMVDFAVEQLAERGVFKVDIETNAEHSAGRLWELKGFKVAKIGYSMQLEKPSGERYA
jgi:hypothetical protein